VTGLRRFSVRNTRFFSCARPTNSTPSAPGPCWASNSARYSCARSSLRCPAAKSTSGTSPSLQNRWIEATKALLIGSINADDANVAPRWPRRNHTTPFTCCNRG